MRAASTSGKAAVVVVFTQGTRKGCRWFGSLPLLNNIQGYWAVCKGFEDKTILWVAGHSKGKWQALSAAACDILNNGSLLRTAFHKENRGPVKEPRYVPVIKLSRIIPSHYPAKLLCGELSLRYGDCCLSRYFRP